VLCRLLLLLMVLVGAGAVEAPPMDTSAGAQSGDQVRPGTARSSDDDTVSSGADGETLETALPGAEGGVSMTLSTGEGRDGTSNAVKILLLITVLAVAPGFLMMMTSFTRIIIVLGFVRRALGTQTLPPNQVMLGMALFLSFFVMAPTLSQINDGALQPYLAEEIGEDEALESARGSIRDFMARHTRKNDLALFIKIAGEERPRSIDDVSFTTLVPAYITSELKTSFQMGFIIFLPFIIIDIVVAAVLMALGMMMLPPVIVSLPFKILLFVLVDGWTLLIQSLAASYA